MNAEHDATTKDLPTSASPRPRVSASLGIPVSICPSPFLLLTSTWLAESAWAYLVLVYLACHSNPESAFSPVSVLIPYGGAVFTAVFLAFLARASDTLSSSPSSLKSWAAVTFTVVQILEGLASLLLVIWWELYRTESLFDSGWLSLAIADARGSTGELPPAAWLILVSILLWWRGHYLVRDEIDFQPLLARFVWGTVILLILESYGASNPFGSFAPWVLGAYLLLGLTALAVSRQVATESGRLGGVDQGWRWRGSALAVLMVVASFGFSLLLLPQLGELADWLWNTVVVPLFFLLLDILRWIAHLLGLDEPPEPMNPLPGEAAQRPSGEWHGYPSLPEWLREVGRWVFNLSWGTVIIYGIYSWVKRWRLDRGRAATAGAKRSRIPWRWYFHPQAIIRWILRLLSSRWPALLRWMPWTKESEEQLNTVRQLYRKLLDWGAEHALPRPDWVTPLEYQTSLSTRWPDLQREFATVTESYLRVRYGGQPLDKGEWEAVLADWLKIVNSGDSR